MRRRIESLCKLINVEPAKTVKLDVDDLESPQTDEASKTADALSGKIEEIRERQRQIQQELMRLHDVYDQIGRQKSFPPDLMQEGSRFLTFLTGRIPPEGRNEFTEEVEKVPAVPISLELETGGEFVVIVLKRNEAALKRVLESYGWQKLDLQDEEVAVSEGNRMQIRKRIEVLEEEQKTLRERVEDTVREEQDTLLRFWKNLRLNELYNTIEKKLRPKRPTPFSLPDGSPGRCRNPWTVRSGRRAKMRVTSSGTALKTQSESKATRHR